MSPRAFDSGEEQHGVLAFVENVDCPRCGCVFEGLFTVEALDTEDIHEPPAGVHTCPSCAHLFGSAATGWHMYGEPG